MSENTTADGDGLTHNHREHLYLVTDHPNEEHVGRVEFASKPHLTVEKNEEGTVHIRNLESGDSYNYECVGMGHYDFECEEASNDPGRCLEVVESKMEDLDDRWLEKAGVEENAND